MKRLLNDIRNYARTGRNGETSGAQLTARALVAEVVEDLHVPPAFSIRCAPDLEDITVEQIPLNQVFHNLIGNALKHHDRATGTIVVSVDARGSMLRFSVIDDGPGIPKEYREEIFGMFKTLKPRDEMEGSGMGLALVRKLVLRMGGYCGVAPVSDRGAEFWFDWPTLPLVSPGAA
jgi:signal transduction histidine kinase